MEKLRANQTKTSATKEQTNASASRQSRASGFDASATPLQFNALLCNRVFDRFLQTKLEVNQLGDEYEQEADRVAEQVFRPH